MTVQLHHGDALELLSVIPDESIDMVWADPPFNIGLSYGGNRSNDLRADYYEWCKCWIDGCYRVLKPTGTFYHMTLPRHLPKLYPLMDKGVFINHINWRNVSAARSPRAFWTASQPILVFGKTAGYKFNRYAQTRKDKQMMRWGEYTTEAKGQLLDYWDDIPFVYAGSIAHAEAVLKPGTNQKAHPAQMPIALGERALLFSTDEGDTVLDVFAGSGSMALACRKSNRHYIGFESVAEYCALAQKRIADAQMQPALGMML